MDTKGKLDEITPGTWHYQDGQVEDERGEIVARAYREATCKIPAYQRDNNMKFISAAPIGYELAQAIICMSATWRGEGILEVSEIDYLNLKQIALDFKAKAMSI